MMCFILILDISTAKQRQYVQFSSCLTIYQEMLIYGRILIGQDRSIADSLARTVRQGVVVYIHIFSLYTSLASSDGSQARPPNPADTAAFMTVGWGPNTVGCDSLRGCVTRYLNHKCPYPYSGWATAPPRTAATAWPGVSPTSLM